MRRYDTTRPWESTQLRGSRGEENEMMSIYPGVSRIWTPCRSVHLRYPCISVHPPSLINDVLGGRDRSSCEMHLEAKIKWTQRRTCRPRSDELGDALGGHDGASLEMRWEALIERVWRCTLRPWSHEVRHAIGDRDWVNSEMGNLLGAGNWLGAGDCWCWDDAVHDVCCTRC